MTTSEEVSLRENTYASFDGFSFRLRSWDDNGRDYVVSLDPDALVAFMRFVETKAACSSLEGLMREVESTARRHSLESDQ